MSTDTDTGTTEQRRAAATAALWDAIGHCTPSAKADSKLLDQPAAQTTIDRRNAFALDRIDQALARGADPNARDSAGVKALSRVIAATAPESRSRIAMVRTLLDHGARVGHDCAGPAFTAPEHPIEALTREELDFGHHYTDTVTIATELMDHVQSHERPKLAGAAVAASLRHGTFGEGALAFDHAMGQALETSLGTGAGAHHNRKSGRAGDAYSLTMRQTMAFETVRAAGTHLYAMIADGADAHPTPKALERALASAMTLRQRVPAEYRIEGAHAAAGARYAQAVGRRISEHIEAGARQGSHTRILLAHLRSLVPEPRTAVAAALAAVCEHADTQELETKPEAAVHDGQWAACRMLLAMTARDCMAQDSDGANTYEQLARTTFGRAVLGNARGHMDTAQSTLALRAATKAREPAGGESRQTRSAAARPGATPPRAHRFAHMAHMAAMLLRALQTPRRSAADHTPGTATAQSAERQITAAANARSAARASALRTHETTPTR